MPLFESGIPVGKISATAAPVKSRGPSDFHLEAETQHSPNEFNVDTTSLLNPEVHDSNRG